MHVQFQKMFIFPLHEINIQALNMLELDFILFNSNYLLGFKNNDDYKKGGCN